MDVDRALWQSYLDIASQETKFLPLRCSLDHYKKKQSLSSYCFCIFQRPLYLMAKTDRPELCRQFVLTHLTHIQHQRDRCNLELIRQKQSSSSISITLPSMEIVDIYLKQYVDLQQSYLSKRMEHQLSIANLDIQDQKLYHQLSAYHLTSMQQRKIEQLIHLRQSQLEIYEEMAMLKERILHQNLPSIYDQMKQYMTTDDFYRPCIGDQTLAEMKTKRRKILQQGKRAILQLYMYAYQFKINDYQQRYQQALDELELTLTYNKLTIHGSTLFQALQTYMMHRTDRLKNEINDKLSHYREIIARRRQRSSMAKKTVGVSPQVTIDVLHHTFNADELAFLSRGKTESR